MLKKGRKSYENANQEALALLTGMEYVPVQRNKGIYAIISDDLNGCPIPVRVQRPDETIPEAAQRLYRAAKSKRSAVMFLIATKKGGYFPSMNPLLGTALTPLILSRVGFLFEIAEGFSLGEVGMFN